MAGIYKITSPSGKIYIGCTINFKRRFSEYKRLNGKGQIKIHRSLLKYGFEAHKFDIIEECSVEQLNEREIYWINFYDCIKNGLNIRLGNKNGSITDEIKQKISKALKGRKNTWAKKGGGSKGYKYTDEQIQKMSKPRINKWVRDKMVSIDVVNEIRTKYNNGVRRSDLSREYRISWGTVKNITDKINSYKEV